MLMAAAPPRRAPSGKDETRLILSPEQIDATSGMLSGVQHLLKFGDGPSDAIMVDNADWLTAGNISFLREVGGICQPHADDG
jgi:tyrosyl-tRNA synthetase